jgi:Tfp pilus assembly protein PilN
VSQQINLFNPIFLKQKKYFSFVAMLQALGILMLGSVIVAVWAGMQLQNLNKEAEVTTEQLNAAQVKLAQVKAEFGPGQNSGLDEQVKKAESEVRAMREALDVIRNGDFGNTNGYSAYLRAFARQIVDGVWLTGVNINGAGTQVELQGRAVRADLVPSYVNRLKRETVMQGKSFATLEMQVPTAVPAQAPAAGSPAKPPELAGYIEFTLR